MRILRFIGRKINGYINLDINFNSDLTFITGINGSGKTTALNCMTALLMPRLNYLVGQQFEQISVWIEHEGKELQISAVKENRVTELTCSAFDSSIKLHDKQYEEYFADGLEDEEIERQRTFEFRYKNKDIMRFIHSLPTPMFLGLDRRMISSGNQVNPDRKYVRRQRYLESRLMKKRRNIFGKAPEQGLTEALYFLQENYRIRERKVADLENSLRKDLISELVKFAPISLHDSMKKPNKKELQSFDDAKQNILRLPSLLGISDSLTIELDAYFSYLDDRAEKLNPSKTRNTGLVSPDSPDFEAQIEWSYNKAHFNKLISISDVITEYNKSLNDISRDTDDFVSSINMFFEDSGKELIVSSFGEATFRVFGENVERELHTLSSGEMQLFVILTHLHFNPEANKVNVLIIDEPELSLHIEWQEKFVDGVIKANNNVQLIMATHSPSIILEKTNYCRDISVQ
ncbi:hypothetical protein GCM10007094_28510 [Pseudovibrio japonicus]|uniref:AAA+ ATPase domain-containing protein n=1 Tax=Pseudovibrio japonicus TaxID=366534 RepID=A0ABQ3EHI3_9HYPH|nr:AAA family ATPase [Pseudovibrio japonicus]GHB37484.1 hypothetical protein GCM10007094_28510 [Pseudovibrio japonicus]